MNRVIIDTSIWIDFFKGRLSQKDKVATVALMEANQISIPFVVKHELLIGCNSTKEFQFVKKKLDIFASLAFEESDLEQLAQFGYELRKKGLLAKYSDLLIAYLSHKTGMPIYSFDTYFKKLERIRIIKTFSAETLR